jgi:hypothetical protein
MPYWEGKECDAVKEYAKKKNSLVDEAKRRAGMEAKRSPVKRVTSSAKPAPAKRKPASSKSSSSVSLKVHLPRSVKVAFFVVILVVVLVWLIFQIPFARIAHSITEKTHHLGKSVHQNWVTKVVDKTPVLKTSVVPSASVGSKTDQNNTGMAADPTQNLAASTTNSTNTTKPAVVTPPVEPKPVFDFYKVLPARNSAKTNAVGGG